MLPLSLLFLASGLVLGVFAMLYGTERQVHSRIAPHERQSEHDPASEPSPLFNLASIAAFTFGFGLTAYLITSHTSLPMAVQVVVAGVAGAAGSTIAATTTTLGGIKSGLGLLVATDGTLSVDSAAPTLLSGPPLGTDYTVLVRGTATFYTPISSLPGYVAPATAFTSALSAATGTVGTATNLTLTPTGAAWPPNVVLTPHIASASLPTRRAMAHRCGTSMTR